MGGSRAGNSNEFAQRTAEFLPRVRSMCRVSREIGLSFDLDSSQLA